MSLRHACMLSRTSNSFCLPLSTRHFSSLFQPRTIFDRLVNFEHLALHDSRRLPGTTSWAKAGTICDTGVGCHWFTHGKTVRHP